MKRILAVICVLALCFVLTSCGYNPTTVGKITLPDGSVVEVTCGQYLMNQLKASLEAYKEVETVGIRSFSEVLDDEIDGVKVSDWIKAKAQEYCVREYVVTYLFDLTGQEMNENALYMYNYYMEQDWQEYYSEYLSNGVSFDSFDEYNLYSIQEGYLPQFTYGEGCELEIPESELQAYINNNATRIAYLCTVADKFDNTDVTDEEAAELKALAYQVRDDAEKMTEEAGDGESQIINAYNQYTDEYEAIIGYNFSGESLLNGDDVVFKADTDDFDQGVLDAFFSVDEGEYGVYDYGDNCYYIFYRYALTDDDTVDSLRNEIIELDYADDFEEYLSGVIGQCSWSFSEKACKYYSLDNVTLIDD